AMMKAKAHNKAGPAREGDALLQGLVRCGRCRRGMYVGYGGHRSERAHRTMQYRCSESRNQIGGTDCQTIGGKRIDHKSCRPAGNSYLKSAEPRARSRRRRHTDYYVTRVGCTIRPTGPLNRLSAL